MQPTLTTFPTTISATTRQSKEFLLTPMKIFRNNSEGVLIEPTVNSVRISVKIDQADQLEIMLTRCVHSWGCECGVAL